MINRASVFVLLPMVAIQALVGCAKHHPGPTTAEEANAGLQDPEVITPIVPLEFVSTAAGENVETLPVTCDQGAQESCDARDEDCDGAIDEGCGYGSGHMQVTVSWDNGSDLDLYVTDPVGETLSFQRPATPGGGRVDHAGRGDCDREQPNSRIENIRWVRDRPPVGQYTVTAHYWGECVRGGGPSLAVVSISVASKVIGSYRYSLLPGERAVMATFSVQ